MRIVVAVDPPASSGKRADACGIVAAGIDQWGTAYVLEDATASGLRPPEWAAKAVALYLRLQADALVVATNQGGEMVTGVIREVDPSQPVVSVRATPANICAPSRSLCFMRRSACAMWARCRNWRTSSAILAQAA